MLPATRRLCTPPTGLAPTSAGPRRRHVTPTHLLLLAWVAFGIANLLLRDRWGTWLVVGMMPWAAWLLIAAVLLVFLWWRTGHTRLTAAVTLVAAAVTVWSSATPLTRANLAAPSASDIRVVQWNTEFWDLTEPPGALGRRLQSMDADVYVLQEHGKPSQDGGITGLTNEEKVRAWFPGFHVAAHHDLLTISRYPIVAELHGEHGGALVTTVDTPTGPLRVVNVHTVAPYDLSRPPWTGSFWSSVWDRAGTQDRQLDWAARQANDRTAPTLVAGDLNATSGMRDINGRFGRLRDVSTSPWHGTWGIRDVLAWRIDWQLATPTVCVSDFRILPMNPSSDHTPTQMTIRTRQEDQSC